LPRYTRRPQAPPSKTAATSGARSGSRNGKVWGGYRSCATLAPSSGKDAAWADG